MEKVLLIGGPGNISTGTVSELMAKGFETGIFTLPASPAGGFEKSVKFYRGDRNSPEDLKKAVDAFGPDVVIDFACFRPEQAKQTADVLKDRISQYIFISTVDVYGFPLTHLPMRETDRKIAGNCQYARDKMKCEEVLLTMADSGQLPLTIVRPIYSFGPEFVLDLFSRSGGRYMIPRLRAGKPILVPGGGNTLIHASCAYDTGRMIAQLAGHYRSIGRSYNCGHDSPMTHDEYVGLFAKVLKVEPKLVHIPFEVLLGLNLPEINDEILPILTRFNLFFSTEAFTKEFPDFKRKLSLEEAARQYVEHNDRLGRFGDPNEENFEDRIIKAWLSRVKDFSIQEVCIGGSI